jgi:murein tripeptide amidase MpaA
MYHICSTSSTLNQQFKNIYFQILAYTDEIINAFPELVSIITFGSTSEDRMLKAIKVSNGPDKKGIFFDAAMHAREWIGPPTLLYAINQLTENQKLLDANDWYFLLVANPEGYIHSWTVDRFWRKTRSFNSNTSCRGTDLNRNFDQHWGGQT